MSGYGHFQWLKNVSSLVKGALINYVPISKVIPLMKPKQVLFLYEGFAKKCNMSSHKLTRAGE